MRALRTNYLLRCCAAAMAFASLSLSASGAIKAEGIPALKPPRGTVKEMTQARSHLPWIVAATCLAAAAVLVWPRMRRPEVRESLYVMTARELRGMRNPDATSMGELVRGYMAQAFGAPGPGQTFEELAALLGRDPRWTPILKERLRRLIEPLEIARFAPMATPADMEKLREEALTLLADAESLRRPPVRQPA